MSTELLNLVRAVREQCGRPVDDALMERVRTRISALSPSEQTTEKAIMRSLLHHVGKVPVATKNRDKP